jgi:hypothetical protein
MVVLARALANGDVALAAFIVDVYCLGVKSARFSVVSPDQWAALVQPFDLEDLDPACLRQLIEGAVAYARDLGFAAPAEYAAAAALFGNIDAAACPRHYTYGKDGKPLYVSGAEDTPAQSQHILETLSRRLGAQGFHFQTAVHHAQASLGGKLVGPVTLCSYEITDQPIADAAFDRLPAEVQEQINALYPRVMKSRPSAALAEVRVLITQHPEITQLHNYLYAAYHNMGEHAEARARRRGDGAAFSRLSVRPYRLGRKLSETRRSGEDRRDLREQVRSRTALPRARALPRHGGIGLPQYRRALLSRPGRARAGAEIL